MTNLEQRIIELRALKQRNNDLKEFIDYLPESGISEIEADLIRRQYNIQIDYIEVLAARIALSVF